MIHSVELGSILFEMATIHVHLRLVVIISILRRNQLGIIFVVISAIEGCLVLLENTTLRFYLIFISIELCCISLIEFRVSIHLNVSLNIEKFITNWIADSIIFWSSIRILSKEFHSISVEFTLCVSIVNTEEFSLILIKVRMILNISW